MWLASRLWIVRLIFSLLGRSVPTVSVSGWWENQSTKRKKLLAKIRYFCGAHHQSAARCVSPLAKDGGKCHRLESVEAYPLRVRTKESHKWPRVQWSGLRTDWPNEGSRLTDSWTTVAPIFDCWKELATYTIQRNPSAAISTRSTLAQRKQWKYRHQSTTCGCSASKLRTCAMVSDLLGMWRHPFAQTNGWFRN